MYTIFLIACAEPDVFQQYEWVGCLRKQDTMQVKLTCHHFDYLNAIKTLEHAKDVTICFVLFCNGPAACWGCICPTHLLKTPLISACYSISKTSKSQTHSTSWAMFSKMPVKSCKCDGFLWRHLPNGGKLPVDPLSWNEYQWHNGGLRSLQQGPTKAWVRSPNEASLDSNRDKFGEHWFSHWKLCGCKLKGLFSRNAPWILSDDCNHGDLSPFVSHDSWLTMFL